MLKSLLKLSGIYLLLSVALPLSAAESSGFLKLNLRYFAESEEFGGAGQSVVSIEGKYALYQEWKDDSIYFEAYLRSDTANHDWKSSDIRELVWTHVDGDVEYQLGIGKVFWGVTESQHLVDIINQTDLSVSIDGETKLGQPMIKATYAGDWWQLEGYLLPGFRKRRFSEGEQRLQFFPDVDYDDVLYESASRHRHTDVALRWSATLDALDLGVSYFSGTSREPRFVLNRSHGLSPFYEQIEQLGVDAQLTLDAWLLKLEAISRSGQGERFTALAAGFEYTYYQVMGSEVDVGVLAEYLYDSRPVETSAAFREESNPAVFPSNTFWGARFTFNDVATSDLLIGLIVDGENKAVQGAIEYQRRFYDNYKFEFEMRYFDQIEKDTLFYGLRKDSYWQMSVSRHF
ncbi:hypothetical protein O0V09_18245 [Dasania sp. GY-19]|uniref:Uncharacterized protein n=1 Tax=Dasania phycosphaerae TaxID=2950436 RepID=A0A9J6RR23_9GAMM|nr:hypothetical protein [Dasania phycosphaerae]MCZ0867142.1 hypothetical protein [Dasania phycosphaerae]